MHTTTQPDHVSLIRDHAAVFDVPTHAVIATTLDGTIVYWSVGARKLYGWTGSDVLGKNIIDVTPTDQSRAQAEAIMLDLMAGRTWSGQFSVRDNEQQEFNAQVRDVPVHDDCGNFIGIIGVSQRVD